MAASELAMLRILVVEDHPRMRMLIKQMLKAGGVTDIEEATNGAEALEYLHKPRSALPDLIMTDLHMEGVDGIGLCNAIRRDKNAEIRAIPILVLTGDEDKLVHEVAEQVGAMDILTKPISATELFKSIGRAVGFAG
jgi:two-component system chemotaxis response regulator CheY